MKKLRIDSFPEPVYITRPLLPNMSHVVKKLEDIWKSRQITNNGLQHKIFEERLVDILKAPYLSLFNNGTTALMTASRVLKLSGEVITTPFTFSATPHSLTWNHIEPVFCDIDPVTMNIDANKIESAITNRTTGILAVHAFGIPCDVSAIQEIANKYGLKIIYDAAHAFGVEVNGVGIGNYGDITMISFHATKLFHTAEGGVLICSDKDTKDYIDIFKNSGMKNEENIGMFPGINGKMNEIQAALGLLILDLVEEDMRKRKELVDVYRSRLKDIEGISFQKDMIGMRYNNACFVIRIDEEKFGKSRDCIYSEYKKYNVFTRKYYSPLCSEYPHYRNLPSSDHRNLPVAIKVVKQVLSLPLYGELSIDDVEKICDILIEMRNV